MLKRLEHAGSDKLESVSAKEIGTKTIISRFTSLLVYLAGTACLRATRAILGPNTRPQFTPLKLLILTNNDRLH